MKIRDSKDKRNYNMRSKNQCRYMFLYILITIVCCVLVACNKDKTETKNESQGVDSIVDNTEDSLVSDNNKDDNKTSSTNDIEDVKEDEDLDSSEFYEDIPDGQLIEKQHNIFQGFIGDEKVIMDLYVKESKVTITYVGDDRTVEYVLEGEQKDAGVLAKNEDNSIILVLNPINNGSLNGACYRSGLKEKVDIQFDYITGGSKIKERYAIGADNTDIEKFAQDIIDAVNNETYSYLYEHIQFPIKVTGKKSVMILNKELLYKKKIFNNRMKKALNESFSKFMYSTKDGIRIGDETYNVWVTLNSNNEWKIIEVNK